MVKEPITRGTVLAVDDTPGNLRVLLETLSSANHDVLVATDGETAIEIAEESLPDLILLDVIMPGISGFTTCERLKRNPKTARIPVIFMTALSETDEKVKAFELGAVDFVPKPFAEAELLARVHTHLALNRLRIDMEKRNVELEELNRIKNEFLGMAAHDVRNPLSTVMASADLIAAIAGSAPVEKITTYAGHISTAAARINAIITNLLDVNAIESGERRLKPSPTDLGALVHQTVQQYNLRARKKEISVILNSAAPAAEAFVDAGAAEQVVENILSNAVKYSPNKRAVTVSLTEDDAMVRIAVADQGPGLSEEDQAKMFGKFCRLAPKPTGGEPSTGLGLWIVKHLTESMHGTIRCESTLGKGTTFIVEWPRREVAEDAA